MYTKEELSFILYNNRSVSGVVANFLGSKKFDSQKLIEIENQLEWCKKPFDENRNVEIPVKDFDMEATDIVVQPIEVNNFLPQVEQAYHMLRYSSECKVERDWLTSRGITVPMMEKWRLGSLNSILEDKYALIALGIWRHPMLANILSDDMSGGGILIPLYSYNDSGMASNLINCTTRRISDVGKLKYTQACPDLDVWGLGKIKGGHVWITEGLFDMQAIFENSAQAASVSGAMWSGPQLYQLMEVADSIDIFADNDQVGLRCAKILQRFLRMRGFVTKTFVSKSAKDPAEHFLEKKLGWDDVVEIDITKHMIESSADMTFNFVKYLKNRRF